MATVVKKRGRNGAGKCEECPHWKEVRNKVRIAEAVQKAITTMDAKFRARNYKPTVAEYLKLLQLAQDFEQEEVKEIKVTWVEPTERFDTER